MIPDRTEGVMWVGTNGAGNVIVNTPIMGVHDHQTFVFSPQQARQLADVLEIKANVAEAELKPKKAAAAV